MVKENVIVWLSVWGKPSNWWPMTVYRSISDLSSWKSTASTSSVPNSKFLLSSTTSGHREHALSAISDHSAPRESRL